MATDSAFKRVGQDATGTENPDYGEASLGCLAATNWAFGQSPLTGTFK